MPSKTSKPTAFLAVLHNFTCPASSVVLSGSWQPWCWQFTLAVRQAREPGDTDPDFYSPCDLSQLTLPARSSICPFVLGLVALRWAPDSITVVASGYKIRLGLITTGDFFPWSMTPGGLRQLMESL